MNKLVKRILQFGIPLAMAGCVYQYGTFNDEDVYKTGTVVAEQYIPRSLGEKTHVGFWSNSDYVGMAESQYLVTLNVDGRTWVLDVQDSYNGGSKEALDQMLDQGDRVTFKAGYREKSLSGKEFGYYSDFRNGRGNIFTSEVRVH